MINIISNSSIMVTGGAGFIGSHLVDRLLEDGNTVHVIDNLSTGSIEYVNRWTSEHGSRFRFFKLDLVSSEKLCTIDKDHNNNHHYSLLFHLAANPDVRSSSINPKVHLEQNIIATFNTLEYARKHDIDTFVFTSSSTVYGETNIIPTPEDTPPNPISVYGASKASCEALICSYAHTYGIKAVIYRLANVIGARSTHGILYDFIKKLQSNKSILEILGDGKQRKSYIHIDDCIDAMLTGLKSNEKISIFNVGSDDYVDVLTIANTVINSLGLSNVEFRFVHDGDGRGWKGDVRTMLLDSSKLKTLGWRVRYNSREAIRVAIKEYINYKNV